MKIAQYKCSLSSDSVQAATGFTIENVESLAQGKRFDNDVLIWNNCEQFVEEELAHFPKLKVLINWGTDDDNLDMQLLKSRDITVKKVDFYATETLAEYILSLMLLYERQHTRLLAGEKAVGNELYRKKIGIIGLGKIGFRTATMLKEAFACQIYYYSRIDKNIPGFVYAPIEALFTTCDYIIIATKSGTLSIDINSLPVVNPQLVVVNIARDSVLPLESLLPMLRTDKLRGYIGDLSLDKIAMEPLPDNVLLLEHRGYLTHSAAEIKRNILLFYLRKISGNQAAPIYVVRHGETEWNIEGRMQGSMDSPLSSAGRKHARDMAAALKGQDVAYVFTSPLARAQTTARVIADSVGAELVIVPEFAEMNFGVFEGQQKKKVEQDFSAFFEERNKSEFFKLFVPYAGGESYYDVYLRVLNPLLRILAEGLPCIIVGHESVNRMLRGITVEKSLEDMIHARQKNHEIVRIDVSAGTEKISAV